MSRPLAQHLVTVPPALAALGVLTLLVALPTRVMAQDSTVRERVRLLEDQGASAFTPVQGSYLSLPDAGRHDVDFGGWGTVTYLGLHKDNHQSGTPEPIKEVVQQDYRLWLQMDWLPRRRLYVRARNLDFTFHTQPGVVPPDTRTQAGPDLDLAFLELDPSPRTLVRIGRQPVRAGRGLVLSADLDGAEVDYADQQWMHRLFAGKTIARDPSIDASIVGYDQGTQDRLFSFIESRYTMLAGRALYGYYLVERDRSRSLDPTQSVRNFAYDAQYLALGSDGRIARPLQYYIELIHEFGQDLADLPGDPRVPIDADAMLAGLLYYPRGQWHPLLTLEFARGSGDPRRASVTNTFGGKQTATSDTNFLYFGAFDGGLALSPRLSDLRVVRLGYQLKLLPQQSDILPELLVGTKLSYYAKDDANGIISDPLAGLATTDVGYGGDAFLAWRPYSDVSAFIQYGTFQPGNAYLPGANARSSRVLVATTVTF